MEKRFKFNLGNIIALTTISYVVYYLLMRDNAFHSSISSIISRSHHMAIAQHLLVLGLIPIYISVIVFGAAMLGIYLGSSLQQVLVRTARILK